VLDLVRLGLVRLIRPRLREPQAVQPRVFHACTYARMVTAG
jgi:hypothetical protein